MIQLGLFVNWVVVASIVAAYMSTIGTHLNWGASYLVNDFYSRFIKQDADQQHLVSVGRVCTILLMVFSGVVAIFLKSAGQAFELLLISGAGTGAIYILRWFWWRINAITEIVAMFGAIFIGCVLVFGFDGESLAYKGTLFSLDGGTVRLLLAIGINTLVWVATTFLTKPENKETLYKFYRKTKPGGPGWAKLRAMAEEDGVDIEGDNEGKPWRIPYEILCVFLGTIMIYSCLFAIGSFIFQKIVPGLILAAVSAACCFAIFITLNKIRLK